MFKEHALVAIKRALPSLNLEPGAVGVVVHVHKDFEAYEVEFLNQDGQTLGVGTLKARDLDLEQEPEPLRMGDALAAPGRQIGWR